MITRLLIVNGRSAFALFVRSSSIQRQHHQFPAWRWMKDIRPSIHVVKGQRLSSITEVTSNINDLRGNGLIVCRSIITGDGQIEFSAININSKFVCSGYRQIVLNKFHLNHCGICSNTNFDQLH